MKRYTPINAGGMIDQDGYCVRDSILRADNQEWYYAAEDVHQIIVALKMSIERMERLEVKVEGEWGLCRDLDELEKDGDLSEELVNARIIYTKSVSRE